MIVVSRQMDFSSGRDTSYFFGALVPGFTSHGRETEHVSKLQDSPSCLE
jgi:hypothetical protein